MILRFSLSLLISVPLLAQTITFSGTVNDQKTNAYILSESHTRKFNAGKPLSGSVVYRDKAGKVLGRKTFTFPAGPYCPAFHFKDERDGWEEGISISGGTATMFLKKSAKDAMERKAIALTPNTACDDGIDLLLRDRRNDIAAGKQVDLRVIVPNKFDHFSFVARKGAEGNVKGRKTMTINMVTQSAILRPLMPALYFTYYMDTGELVNSAGLHIMNDAAKKSYRVKAFWSAEKKS